MSFPRYPEYKDSGVEWLGRIPSHWDAVPLKHVAEFVNGDAFKPTDWADSGMPIIRIQNLNGGEDFNYTNTNVEERYRVFNGDLLFGWSGNRGTSFGPFRWRHDAICALNQHIFRVIPRSLDKNELYWMLKAVTKHVEDQAHGIIGMVHVTKGDLGAICVPLAAADEQVAIATFLDRETAKIDALIAEQERLMELLKEKRQAVISHAVTKGLNPDAPMKDSGVEWLGEVPAHWNIMRLKALLASTKAGPFGSSLTKDRYVAEGFRVYGQEQVIPNDFAIGDYFIDQSTFEELSQYAVQTGDILVSCVGTFGKIAIVPSTAAPGIINPRLIRLRVSAMVDNEYLVEAMRSAVTFDQLSYLSRGGTMDVINIGTLGEVICAVPPFDEQLDLVLHIRGISQSIDSLAIEIETQMNLLRERRTALISAAVTGQIDVRHLANANVA